MTERKSARQPIADQMYGVLLHQFMSGERGAGESLNIGALSRELDVSQTPLREALARLEYTGLVQREALRGYRVAPVMTRAEVEQLKEARLVLEPRLARDAALRVTPGFLSALRESMTEFERSADAADMETEGFDMYWRSDNTFHTLIAEQSGNQFLALAYAALSGQIQRFRLFSKFGRTGARHAAPEHRRIFDAIEAGDADAAAEAMRLHVLGATGRLLGN
ncbi:GntR family transcriptional regulator [Agrococcus baldri]|uniref:GntR family transcriptional regulator n=1 Tax=Agrococcus baldri TaxID=153730 RepID=A0AA87RG30_9MICO|nr:GntR family transcriptional regulator [Agrococcus baldri]GEK79750.1 GntR family transcriptional regulator [Agrococcus baldri]